MFFTPDLALHPLSSITSTPKAKITHCRESAGKYLGDRNKDRIPRLILADLRGPLRPSRLHGSNPSHFNVRCWAFDVRCSFPPFSLDPEHRRMEQRSLYEHLQTRMLEMIETLDEVRTSADHEVFEAAEEARELAGEVPF